jgi:signal transduction histidine kinase/AmiR/NasT family two-component response regulator
MKNMLRTLIYRYVFSDEVPLEAKMINTIYLTGVSFAVLAIVTRILMGASVFLLLVVAGIALSVVFLMSFYNRSPLYRVWSWIAIVVLCDMLFPAAYFALGGVASSAPAYFVLTIVIIVLLSRGRSCVVFLVTHIIWVAVCYYISYRFPNLVVRIGEFAIYREPRIYLDHLQSILIVGGCTAVIIKIQNKIYLMEREKADHSNRQVLLRDKLLRLVNDAAVILLESDEGRFEESLRKSLESMALCMDVDRICIWKNQEEPDKPCYMKLFEWMNNRPFWREEGGAKALPVCFDGLPGWEEEFSRGRTINGPLKNLSPAERALLPSPDIVSILAIPVFLQDRYWGFVSFSDYREERRFSVQEEDILQSGSLLIANAVARNEMTGTLIKAREEALNSTRAKSAFLARMSHEIRTPLNAILGLSEVELQSHPAGRTRLNLEKIHGSGSHLLEIVNDILDISKIESGNFEILPGEYEFPLLVGDVIQLNILRIGMKPVEFKLELDETIPVKLYGDELRLKQILNNLLSNAFKYTEEGEVCLRIDWERRGDTARLTFTVEDTGRGIKREDLRKLFSEYTQIDAAANRRIEGTGLGLSIARGLVEIMGGTITVESEYGRGSVFRLCLPQGIVDETPLGAAGAEKLRSFHFMGGRQRNRGNLIHSWMPYGRVLVVDDIPTNLDVMAGLLMPYGLKVDTALSGREAVEALRKGEGRYDLVFMDHMMPEMDGVEAVRIIRKELGAAVPVVVLTANAIAGNRELFLESGFNDFISKPIDIKQLDGILKQWIRDKQSAETLAEAGEQAAGRGEHTPSDAGGWLLARPVAGLDFSAALALYDGELYIPILRSFVNHTPPLLEKMELPSEESLGDYTVKVHGLKGACTAVCAGEAAALAGELERASREGDFDRVSSDHGELRRKVLAVVEGLRALLGEWDAAHPEGEKEGRAEPDRELLARLSEAASQFNSSLTGKLLGELERYRYERGGELIPWLRRQAEKFDYDAIRRRLEELPYLRPPDPDP